MHSDAPQKLYIPVQYTVAWPVQMAGLTPFVVSRRTATVTLRYATGSATANTGRTYVACRGPGVCEPDNHVAGEVRRC